MWPEKSNNIFETHRQITDIFSSIQRRITHSVLHRHDVNPEIIDTLGFKFLFFPQVLQTPIIMWIPKNTKIII